MSGHGKRSQADNAHEASADAGAGDGKASPQFAIGDATKNQRAYEATTQDIITYDKGGTLSFAAQKLRLPPSLICTRPEITFAISAAGELIPNTQAGVKAFLMAEARSNKPPAMQGKYGTMTPQKAATSDETAEAAAEALMRPRDTAISDEIQRELEAAMSQALEVAERLEELERAIRSDTVKTKRLAKLMASMEPDSEEFAAKEADLTLVKRRLKTNKAAFLSDTVESKRVESRLGNIERMRLDTKIKEARCREELS